ncbi:MAG: hypothetical protein MI924_01535 [Chloroflexales bacterium]|nr:hypothetical protein [Chloroflexales bacterium]
MHILCNRLHRRMLLMGFTASLAMLLVIWSYSSWAATASLAISSSVANQNDTVTLIGEGFDPNEIVSIWITDPEYRVYTVAEVKANEKGEFDYPYIPDYLGAEFTPTGKYTYSARGKSSGREVHSNVRVNIGSAPASSPGVRVIVEPGDDRQGSFFVVRGANYGAEERLAIWLRYPDHTVENLGYITTDQNGAFEYTLRIDGAPIGRYAFTARSLNTGLNGISEFNLRVNDLTKANGAAELRIRPSSDKQRSEIIFEGLRFQAGEAVSIWVTLPDFSTASLGDIQVEEDGTFVASLYISEQVPVGRHTFTAFGNTSKLRGVADFILNPGGVSK